ncbi:Acetyl-CoA acetyltransferase, cytosolic [Ancistrocladus abbreviatus]
MLAAQSIQLGINDVVVAGGMESMSNVPKYISEARKGCRLGHDTLVDGMLKDGLWNVYNDFGMGVCAELCAEHHTDNYACQSFERGIAAQERGAFALETVPEAPTKFQRGWGTVTAGNASSISDGATALVLVSGEKTLRHGLEVIAKITGYADAAQAPELFTTAPALSIPKAITNAGLNASQSDFYEINEALSVVALANMKLLGLSLVSSLILRTSSVRLIH